MATWLENMTISHWILRGSPFSDKPTFLGCGSFKDDDMWWVSSAKTISGFPKPWGYPNSCMVYFLEHPIKTWMITGATPIETSIYRWFTTIYLFQNQNVFFFHSKLWNYWYVHATFTPRWTIKDGYARLSIRGLGTGSSVRPIWCIHRSSFRNSPNEPRRFCMVFYLRTRRIYSFWCPSYYQIIHIYDIIHNVIHIWYDIYNIILYIWYYTWYYI